MPSGIRGDYSRLHALGRKFDRISRAGFRTELNEALSEAAADLIDDQIRTQSGPYGENWDPTTEGDPAFDGARGDTVARASGKGFRIHSGIPFGLATHQRGRTIRPRNGEFLVFKLADRVVFARKVTVPARPIVPEQSRGLGPVWRERFHRVADKIFRETMK